MLNLLLLAVALFSPILTLRVLATNLIAAIKDLHQVLSTRTRDGEAGTKAQGVARQSTA